MITEEQTKEQLKRVRSIRGNLPESVNKTYKENNQIQKTLLKCLEERPKTVLDLHQETQIPKDKIFWHLMALKKYNFIQDDKKQEEYILYAKKAGVK